MPSKAGFDCAHGWQGEPTDEKQPEIRGFALPSVGVTPKIVCSIRSIEGSRLPKGPWLPA
ncbi:hypothetical protein CKO51_06275 [Rhodopirellula sp. SM50]|nr:hypothetical protein CKO51_06275 [Rhodopirellula sp. SM50]